MAALVGSAPVGLSEMLALIDLVQHAEAYREKLAVLEAVRADAAAKLEALGGVEGLERERAAVLALKKQAEASTIQAGTASTMASEALAEARRQAQTMVASATAEVATLRRQAQDETGALRQEADRLIREAQALRPALEARERVAATQAADAARTLAEAQRLQTEYEKKLDAVKRLGAVLGS